MSQEKMKNIKCLEWKKCSCCYCYTLKHHAGKRKTSKTIIVHQNRIMVPKCCC